jgi:hypothetical protein
MKHIPETCMRTKFNIYVFVCFCSLRYKFAVVLGILTLHDKHNIHTMSGLFLCAVAVKQAKKTGQNTTFLLFLKLAEASLIFRQFIYIVYAPFSIFVILLLCWHFRLITGTCSIALSKIKVYHKITWTPLSVRV